MTALVTYMLLFALLQPKLLLRPSLSLHTLAISPTLVAYNVTQHIYSLLLQLIKTHLHTPILITTLVTYCYFALLQPKLLLRPSLSLHTLAISPTLVAYNVTQHIYSLLLQLIKTHLHTPILITTLVTLLLFALLQPKLLLRPSLSLHTLAISPTLVAYNVTQHIYLLLLQLIKTHLHTRILMTIHYNTCYITPICIASTQTSTASQLVTPHACHISHTCCLQRDTIHILIALTTHNNTATYSYTHDSSLQHLLRYSYLHCFNPNFYCVPA